MMAQRVYMRPESSTIRITCDSRLGCEELSTVLDLTRQILHTMSAKKQFNRQRNVTRSDLRSRLTCDEDIDHKSENRDRV